MLELNFVIVELTLLAVVWTFLNEEFKLFTLLLALPIEFFMLLAITLVESETATVALLKLSVTDIIWFIFGV